MKIIERVIEDVDGNVALSEETNIVIDPTKTNKMFAILLESYKNARAAMIREYVSNAWDSHREAGNLNPVIVNFDADEAGRFVSITDEGIGMSHDFVMEYFSKLLHSTKEDTNDSIGGFGIGSKTALAYTNSFHVEAIKDGELNYYIIFRETSTNLKISRLLTDRTTQSNGVTIKVYLKEDTYSEERILVETAIKELSYFDNVVLKSNYYHNGISNYNLSKILEADTFKYRTISNYSDYMHIILGKVAYEIDWKEIGLNSYEFAIDVGIPFSIGELEVNMTRESIIYTDVAKALIKQRVLEAKEDLLQRINKQNKPIESIFDYIATSNNKITNLKLGDYSISLFSLKENILGTEFAMAKRLGVSEFNKDFFVGYFFHIVGMIESKTYRQKRLPSISELERYKKYKLVIIKSSSNFSPSLEFRTFIENAIVINVTSNPLLFKYFNKFLPEIKRKDVGDINAYQHPFKLGKIKPVSVGRAKQYLALKRTLLQQLKDTFSEVIEYDNGFKVPEWWKEQQRQLAKAKRVKIQKAEGIISVVDIKTGSIRRDLDLSKLNNNKKLIVYGFTNNTERLKLGQNILAALKTDTKGYEVYKIAQANEKPFLIIPNTVHINTLLMSKNRKLSRLYTLHLIKKLNLDNINENIATILNFTVGSYIKDVKSYVVLNSDSTLLAEILMDKELISELETNAKLLNLGDPDIMYKIKFLQDYFKGLDLLKTIEWNSGNIKLIADFIKLSGKKVNYSFYETTTKPQQYLPSSNTKLSLGRLVEVPFTDLKQYNITKPKPILI